MAKEIYLNGMTADQLSKMIRESLRDELQQFRPAHPKTDTKYLTRREPPAVCASLLVTLTDWVNHGKIRAHKIGGARPVPRQRCRSTLNRIVPIK